MTAFGTQKLPCHLRLIKKLTDPRTVTHETPGNSNPGPRAVNLGGTLLSRPATNGLAEHCWEKTLCLDRNNN